MTNTTNGIFIRMQSLVGNIEWFIKEIDNKLSGTSEVQAGILCAYYVPEGPEGQLLNHDFVYFYCSLFPFNGPNILWN